MSSARGSAEENARGDGHRDPVLEPSPGEDEDGERGRQRFVDRQGGWVLSSLGDGVLTADGDGVVTFINPAAERLTGWSAADAVGEPVDRAFHLLHEDGERAVSTPIASVLRDGSAASIGGRRQLVRRDGTRLRVGGSVTPLRVEDGKVDGVVIVFRDVSSEALEAEVASRAKDDFLAMLGHELRNPLAPIVSALDLIRMHGAGKFERELAVVGRQLSRVTRLVDDLLDVGRMTGGRLLLRREPVDVSEAVLLASERVGPLVEDRGQQLVLETPGVLLVRGDVDRLSQAIGNLIVNAAKYTPRGGRIRVSAERSAERVLVRVRDNGVGIAPELLSRVFDLFVQDPRPLDRSDGGLGAGLAVVRAIVQAHQGSVSVSSEGRGQGSEFLVELPALVAAPPVTSYLDSSEPERPSVLVVDDNVDAADLLAESLAWLGHRTYTAYDARSAHELASELRPSTALLDIGLPIVDGYELARRLRAQQGDILLIAVTGYGQPSDRDRSRAAGFDEHLVKPVSVDEVSRMVERHLNGDA